MSPPDLGPCCCCRTEKEVRNILSLHFKNPTPGRGWGCVICKLPADGFVAVVCDRCFDRLRGFKGENFFKALKFACRGYPATDGRIPIAEVLQCPAHDHNMELHPEQK